MATHKSTCKYSSLYACACTYTVCSCIHMDGCIYMRMAATTAYLIIESDDRLHYRSCFHTLHAHTKLKFAYYINKWKLYLLFLWFFHQIFHEFSQIFRWKREKMAADGRDVYCLNRLLEYIDTKTFKYFEQTRKAIELFFTLLIEFSVQL